MSTENARAFYQKIKADRGLQQKIGDLAKENPAEAETVIIKVAGENGFQFTLEEMRTFIKELAQSAKPSGELDDTQLEAVAGGGKGEWIENSLGTLGIGCLLSALDRKHMGSRGCALDK